MTGRIPTDTDRPRANCAGTYGERLIESRYMRPRSRYVSGAEIPRARPVNEVDCVGHAYHLVGLRHAPLTGSRSGQRRTLIAPVGPPQPIPDQRLAPIADAPHVRPQRSNRSP